MFRGTVRRREGRRRGSYRGTWRIPSAVQTKNNGKISRGQVGATKRAIWHRISKE